MNTPLRRVRERRGISPVDLAAALGVTQPTINRIENGKAKASTRLANDLARYFDQEITRDQILYPEDYPEPAERKTARRATTRLREAS
jgi:DNA-binding XRE family transcriptional regulator